MLARGHAYEASQREVDHLLLEPWAEGDKRHWVRIDLVEVTGRRLDHIDFDFRPDSRGYL